MKIKQKLVAAVTVASLVVGSASVAGADNLVDSVVAGGNDTITAGQSTTIDYWIVANSAGGEGKTPTCDATVTSPATFTINAPAAVTKSRSALSFTDCGTANKLSVVYGSTTAGSYAISVTKTSSQEHISTEEATFTLQVNAGTVPPPADTVAPSNASITINGGDPWTKDPVVTLAISGTDAVGVAKYRLAETHVDLASASDVVVAPAATDFTATPSFTLTGADASAKTVWVRLFDAAGNSVDASGTIGLDTVAPIITGSTGTYTPGSWTKNDVTVTFSCEDDRSGIGSDSVGPAGGVLLSTSGADQEASSTGGCTDVAGNEAVSPVTVDDIDIDKVAPTSTVTGATEGAVYVSAPTVTCTATDSLSGVASNGTPSGDTATAGIKTVTCNGAIDNAGNSQTVASAPVSYTLAPIGGFNTNFDGSAVLKVKPNQAIPLKWAFHDGTTNRALLTGAGISSVSSTRCSSAAGTEGTEVATETAAGASGLQLLPDNSYQMNWKATSTTGCRLLTVTMDLASGGSITNSILVNIQK